MVDTRNVIDMQAYREKIWSFVRIGPRLAEVPQDIPMGIPASAKSIGARSPTPPKCSRTLPRG